MQNTEYPYFPGQWSCTWCGRLFGGVFKQCPYCPPHQCPPALITERAKQSNSDEYLFE